MRLTDKTRWNYDSTLATRQNIDTIQKRDEWLRVIKQHLPNGDLDYLELGCAPGQCSAALSESTDWNVYGIDYSDDADLFPKTLSVVGKEATVYKQDIFEKKLDKKFDIVCSFGLVEHFRGKLSEDIYEIHDHYTKNGGYIAIEMPNMTGFHYFWHYIFDRPDLDNHNVDVMQIGALDWFVERGYEPIYRDYVGVLRLWGNSGYLKYKIVGKFVAAVAVGTSQIAKLLDKIGLRLRGRTFSPALVFIFKKPAS